MDNRLSSYGSPSGAPDGVLSHFLRGAPSSNTRSRDRVTKAMCFSGGLGIAWLTVGVAERVAPTILTDLAIIGLCITIGTLIWARLQPPTRARTPASLPLSTRAVGETDKWHTAMSVASQPNPVPGEVVWTKLPAEISGAIDAAGRNLAALRAGVVALGGTRTESGLPVPSGTRNDGESGVRYGKACGVLKADLAAVEAMARRLDMVAINAAIEAARASELGGGFAIVATEVRSIAQRIANQLVLQAKHLEALRSLEIGEAESNAQEHKGASRISPELSRELVALLDAVDAEVTELSTFVCAPPKLGKGMASATPWRAGVTRVSEPAKTPVIKSRAQGALARDSLPQSIVQSVARNNDASIRPVPRPDRKSKVPQRSAKPQPQSLGQGRQVPARRALGVHLDLNGHGAPVISNRSKHIPTRVIVPMEASKVSAGEDLSGAATAEQRGIPHEEGKQLVELALPGGQDSEDTHFERF